MFRRTTFHSPCLIALLAVACHSPPAPLALPAASLTASYVQAEESASEGSTPAAASRCIELRAIATTPGGTAISQAAAAIVHNSGAPFRGRSGLPIGTRWLADDQVRAWLAGDATRTAAEQQQLGTVHAIVTPNLTTTVGCDTTQVRPLLTGPLPLPELLLWQAATGTEVSLSLLGEQDREVLTIADKIADQDCGALFVPDSRLADGGLLLLIHAADTAPAAELAAAVAAARPAGDANGKQPAPKAWQVARQAIGERNRRPALLALTEPLAASRVTDLILAADEPALIAITKSLDSVEPRGDDLAWRTECQAWRALITRIEREELSPALRAATERHLGAVADDPGTLSLLLKTSGDGETFVRDLIEENVAALNDRSASVRVAALSWLRGQQVVVADYDPMADKAQRRRTVRRFLASRETER